MTDDALHPWVVELSSHLDPDLPPAHAGFPALIMDRQRKALASKRSDRALFEHLLVLALRCEEQGLPAACAQLRELGLIGFAKDEHDAQLKAAEKLHKSGLGGNVGRNNDMAKGLETQKAKAAPLGVGFKKSPPPKKS